MAIVYPSRPQGVDFSGFERGLASLSEGLEERRARKALEPYIDWLGGMDGGQAGGGMGDQMSLASLAPQGGVARAPLPAVATGDDIASQRVAQAHAASGGTPPQGAIEAYIRHAAQKRGIDPEIAIKVAMSEGGVTDPTRQSDIVKDGVREQSYGPFQLFMNGGLGNEALAAGIDPRQDWKGGIDFALDKAKEGGWGPWYGAAKVGITGMDGIGNLIGDGQNRRSVGVLGANGRPMLQNADGSVSTEESITVTDPRLNGGRPTNIPSIWGGQRLREGPAIEAAMRSGQQFQSFGSIDEAVRAAQARSEGLGHAVDRQMAQSAPAGSPASLLPPREVMQGLLRNKDTRQLGIALAQSYQKARMGDPEERLKLQKLQLEIEQLRNPAGKPTDDIREYEFAKSQGFGGSFQDWQLSNKKAGATTVNVGQGEPGDGELRKSLDKAEGDLWSTYKQTGATSGASQQDFAVLDELIKIAPQGPITGRLAEAFPGVSSAGDAFQSIVKRIAPTLRAPGSGATSDIEYDGMLRSLPALRNNPDANILINQIMKEKAALNVRRADIITQYQTNAISAADARRQLSELDKVSIISPEMKQALGIVGSGGKGNRTSSGIEWSLDD